MSGGEAEEPVKESPLIDAEGKSSAVVEGVPEASSSGAEEVRGSSRGGFFTPRRLLTAAAWAIGGGFLLYKALARKSRSDHARLVADAFCDEKYSTEQAFQHPETYYNVRLIGCDTGVKQPNKGERLIYQEQAFWRTPDKPYRQRFLLVKPSPPDGIKSDVEVHYHAVEDASNFVNFCDRGETERPAPEEVPKGIGEHLATVYMSRCERGRKCMYEGATPPGGYPNFYQSSRVRVTTEVSINKGGALEVWDRAYQEEDGSQVWGPVAGPYEFKPKRRELAERETKSRTPLSAPAGLFTQKENTEEVAVQTN